MAGLVTAAPTSGLPGVWAQEMASAPTPPKTPGDIMGLVFEASRGLPGVPTWLRDQNDFNRIFGGRTPTAADATKLLSGYLGYLAPDSNMVMDVLGVRVGTTKMATAKITLLSGANPVLTLWASSPGTWANANLTATVSAGLAAGTWNLLVSNPATGEVDSISGLPMADNAGAIAQINRTASLVYATQPVLAEPAAPTFSGTLAAGTVAQAALYTLKATYLNAAGQTMGSATATTTALAGGVGKLTATVATLAGAASWTGYIGTAADAETLAVTSTTFGSGVDITAPWPASSVTPPFGPIDQTGKQVAATTGAGYTAAIPTAGTFIFPATGATGAGNNGEGATPAQYVGSSASPSTGIYAFANLDLDEQPLYICAAQGGWADGTLTQGAALAAYGAANNCQIVLTLPQGTSAAAAASAWQTFVATLSPLNAKHVKLAWPWATVYDSAYAADVAVSGAPYLAAISAATPANTSAANKVINGLSGLEFTLASDAAAQVLTGASINPLSGRITRKGVGFLSDWMADGSYAYETRMKAELVRRTSAALADFSDIPNDGPNRQLVQDTAQGVFRGMVRDGILEDNPPTASASPPTVTNTIGKTKANSAVGLQPSTTSTSGTSTILHWAAECDDANNLDTNGVPVGASFILDMQMRVTRNADNVWLRYAAGIFQDITIGSGS